MTMRLTGAEAVLYRTGPNNITILFEASGPFDPGLVLRGLHQMVEGAERFHRAIEGTRAPAFGQRQPLEWPRHVSVLNAPGLSAITMMNLARRLALPAGRPRWRAVIANPEGGGWSGLVLQFDHAIADGTRIARHITTRARPEIGQGLPVGGLPCVSLEGLQSQKDARLTPANSGLVRLEFNDLARHIPNASGHADALLRLARERLDADPAFAGVAPTRRNHATMAQIVALRTADGALGNQAKMRPVNLSDASERSKALFDKARAPWMESARIAIARALPTAILRPTVQSEFSRPGIVLTVVPVARRLPPLFGLDLVAIHPAAPTLGRPPLAVTAVRTGDGFDVCVTAHGPKGENVPGLSQRVADTMRQSVLAP
jgi:hypothetical protein